MVVGRGVDPRTYRFFRRLEAEFRRALANEYVL
jgi:hypothetical protein